MGGYCVSDETRGCAAAAQMDARPGHDWVRMLPVHNSVAVHDGQAILSFSRITIDFDEHNSRDSGD